MGTFVTNPSETLPGPKTGDRAVPEGGSANGYFVAADYNALRGAANDLRDAVLGGSASLFTSTGSTTARSGAARFAEVANVLDFGGIGDGSTDNQTAIGLANATGKPVYFPPGTYVTGPVTPSSAMTWIGAARDSVTIKLKSGANDHLIKNTTLGNVVRLRGMTFDGNRSGNNRGTVYPAVIFNQRGSLIMSDCKVWRGVHDHILSGNVDYAFNSSQWSDLVDLDNVEVDGGLATDLGADGHPPQDCFRIFRTKKVRLRNCRSTGGLSGARIGWYCSDVEVTGGTFESTWADVGVTVYMADRFAVTGVTSRGHYQHGFEFDANGRGSVTGCVAVENSRYGILLTEYGPTGTNTAGTVAGVSMTSGNVYSNQGVVISGCTVAKNGKSGLKCIGENAISILSNRIEGNDTTNEAGEDAGVFVDGGTLNRDSVTISGNEFVNVGYQNYSVRQSSVQFTTRSGGNVHVGGRPFEFAVRGPRTNTAPDPLLRLDATLQVVAPLAPDSTGRTGFAREINDTNASGDVTLEAKIPAAPYGNKLSLVRLRNVDTMSSAIITVNLYDDATFLYTASSSTRTGLTSAWTEYVTEVSAPGYASGTTYAVNAVVSSGGGLYKSLQSSNTGHAPATSPTWWSLLDYDNVRVSVTSTVAGTGKLHVEEISLYTASEA